MEKEKLERFIIEIESKFYNEKLGKWEVVKNPYMKVDGKIYLWSKDKKNRKVSFIYTQEEKNITVKAIIADEENCSEGIATVQKYITTKEGKVYLNQKAIEKAQSIALGKALSYLGYGIEYGLASSEEIQSLNEEVNDLEINLDKLDKRVKNVNIKKIVSDVTIEDIEKKNKDPKNVIFCEECKKNKLTDLQITYCSTEKNGFYPFGKKEIKYLCGECQKEYWKKIKNKGNNNEIEVQEEVEVQDIMF